MNFTRVASYLFSAALVFFSVVTSPIPAASVQDSKVRANHSVVQPVGSYDPAGNIGMMADAVGKSRFADIYGGMALVGHGSHVNIYLTKLDPVAERAIQGSAPADRFTFILTPHTEEQALEFHQKVIGLATAIQSNGIHLVEWGPDVKTGKERIGVKDLTPDASAYLTTLLGSENIELQNMDYTPMSLDYHSSDPSPRKSGGFINDETIGDNSSGCHELHCDAQGETILHDSYQLDFASLATMGTSSDHDTSSLFRMTDPFNTYK